MNGRRAKLRKQIALNTLLSGLLSGNSSFSLPYSDNFTYSDGALPSPWTGPTWTISSNAVLNTPTLGSELLVNPGFEGTYDDESGGGGGTIMVAPDWNNSGCETDGTDTLNESATAHGGSKSQLITVNSAAEGVTTAASSLASIGYYQLSCYVNITSGIAVVLDSSNVFNGSTSTTGSWVQIVTTGRTTLANRAVLVRSAGAANFLADDASAKALTASSMFATLPSVGVASVTAQALVTTTPTSHCVGLVINLDSTSSPANFVLAFLTNARCRLDKCVAGTYTNLIDAAITFGASKVLKVIKNGDTYQLFYDGVQIGTNQTITSMNGTLHGLFSTYSTMKLDSYQIAAT